MITLIKANSTDIPQALVKYIQDVTGAPQVLRPVSQTMLARLPIYLANAFDIHRLHLFGHPILFAVSAENAKPDLSQLAKQRELLSEKLGNEVVLVIPKLRSYERRRLIQKRIPFIVPGRQMYLPMMLVDIRESFPAPVPTRSATLGWVGQTILLRHLLSGDITERPLASIAKALGYSAMAISQALDELVALRLCQRIQQGRSKTIQFDGEPRTVWRTALQFMRSPVKKTQLVRSIDPGIEGPLDAGMTALADATNITHGGTKTVAMSAKSVRTAIEAGHIEVCLLEEDAKTAVQVWAYAPNRLSAGPAVDPLSLYLSLRNDPDERVQIAIEQLVDAWK